jgi:hypothetical protein
VNVSAFRILLSEWQTSSNPSHVRFSRLSLGFWKILDSQTIASGITLPSQEMRATRCICIIHERIQVIDEHATHLAFLTRPGETKSWKRKKYIYIYIYIYIYMYVCMYKRYLNFQFSFIVIPRDSEKGSIYKNSFLGRSSRARYYFIYFFFSFSPARLFLPRAHQGMQQSASIPLVVHVNVCKWLALTRCTM